MLTDLSPLSSPPLEQQPNNNNSQQKQQQPEMFIMLSKQPKQEPKTYYNSSARAHWVASAVSASATTNPKQWRGNATNWRFRNTTTGTDTNSNNNQLATAVKTMPYEQRLFKLDESGQRYNGQKRYTPKNVGSAAVGQQTQLSHSNSSSNNSSSSNKNTQRKQRYSNKLNMHQKRHTNEHNTLDGNGRGSATANSGNSAWLGRNFGRRFGSSCVEDQFMGGEHNPGHRNSTSSETTTDDINSSDEHLNKRLSRSNNSKSKNNKIRSKRQQQQQQQQGQRQLAQRAAQELTTEMLAEAKQAGEEEDDDDFLEETNPLTELEAAEAAAAQTITGVDKQLANGTKNPMRQQQQQQQQQQKQFSQVKSNNHNNNNHSNNNNNNQQRNNYKRQCQYNQSQNTNVANCNQKVNSGGGGGGGGQQQKRQGKLNGNNNSSRCNSNNNNNNNNSSSNSNQSNLNNRQQQSKKALLLMSHNSDTSSAVSSPSQTPGSTPNSSPHVGKSNYHHHHYQQHNKSSNSNSICSSSSGGSINGQQHQHRQLMSQMSKDQRQVGRQRHQQQHNANFQMGCLEQYELLELDNAQLVKRLRRHLIDHHLLRVYGFPVESVIHEGAIEIFKCLPHMNFAAANGMAAELPAPTFINCYDGLNTSTFQYSSRELGGGVLNTQQHVQLEMEIPPLTAVGSGMHGSNINSSNSSSSSDIVMKVAPSTDSGNISPRSLDSETGSDWSECCETVPNAVDASGCGYELLLNGDAGYEHLFEQQYVERSLAKQCARCKRDFLVDEHNGVYLTQEECNYHWGKFQRNFEGNAWVGRWTCCIASDDDETLGCCKHDAHVWTGSVVGINGPYRDFVRTRQRPRAPDAPPNVFALDCEMSYTGRGLDVTKVSLVAIDGQLVYEHYVRPDADIVDFNTRYSGVTAKHLKSQNVKTLSEVQRDLLQLIAADTILIGHGLDNDLRALRIVHNTLIDTSIAFPHSSGFPYRRALRHLTKSHLKREIQSGDGSTGHSSFEDSRACMELMLWLVQQELKEEASDDL